VLQVLTYSPAAKGGYYEVLDNALRRAAGRGVKVRLIAADWSMRQPTIQFLKSLALVPNVEIKLSTIPPWSGGHVSYARVEHCKYLVVDGQHAWIGTSNWERDYFHQSRNVGVIVTSDRIADLLRGIFRKSWQGPYATPIDVAAGYRPPRIGE
jgi:phosphatidylserine/phosphatidylglycerophosphate/cardiolipin synthase-like enzyme